MKKSISALTAIFVLLLLLTHPALSYEGACQGLLLWFHTVLPTLLPFMICSNVIVMLGGVSLLTSPFRPLLKPVFKLSSEGSYVLISGLLCGYPMGAKTCSEFLDHGRISLKEARYLLAISNHPSPMFLLGYVATNLSPTLSMTTVLLSLYLPILPVAWAARGLYGVQEAKDKNPFPKSTKSSFDTVMMSSFEVMVRIGGYIMLFSILAAFIQKMPWFSPFWKALLLGIVEITTGIQAVSKAVSGPLQGLCLTMITAFGGLSGISQTKSVLKNAGLSVRHYLLWKLFHAILSVGCFLALSAT